VEHSAITHYHPTSELAAQSIMDDGLKPGAPFGMVPGILLFTDQDKAREFAVAVHGADARLVEVDGRGIGRVSTGEPDTMDVPDGGVMALDPIEYRYCVAVHHTYRSPTP